MFHLWLRTYATADCPFTGGVFHVGGNEVGLYSGWSLSEERILTAAGRFSLADLVDRAPALLNEGAAPASMATSVADTMARFGRRGHG